MSLGSATFEGHASFGGMALVVGTFLVVMTRPTRVLLDVRTMHMRTPRLPLGTTNMAWAIGDVAGLELDTVPRAVPNGRYGPATGYRLVWRLRSGERVPFRGMRMSDRGLRARCDRVNAFLAAHA